VSWDYTTWLNIVFLLLAAALIIRFARTGGGDAAHDGRCPRHSGQLSAVRPGG
jgi:hypothetical protein